MSRWMETKTIFASQELGGGTAAYSSSIATNNLIPDYAALQLEVSATGTLTITQQCSVDGTNWQDPTTSTSVAVSSATILQGVYRGGLIGYIPFTPVIAPYIRLKLAATSTITTVACKLILEGDTK